MYNLYIVPNCCQVSALCLQMDLFYIYKFLWPMVIWFMFFQRNFELLWGGGGFDCKMQTGVLNAIMLVLLKVRRRCIHGYIFDTNFFVLTCHRMSSSRWRNETNNFAIYYHREKVSRNRKGIFKLMTKKYLKLQTISLQFDPNLQINSLLLTFY